MENKINIAELLKDCPKGMELYSPIFGNVKLEKVFNNFIYVFDSDELIATFDKKGKYKGIENGECQLFPSKDQRDWSKFQIPFKDGDVLSYQYKGYKNRTIYIYMQHSKMNTTYYVALSGNDDSEFMVNYKEGHALNSYSESARLATEEEKQKLFDAIKANGYHWNAETKILEELVKPKFKVGDRIKYRSGETVYRIVQITEDSYVLDNLCSILISIEHMYNLVPNKFDITTLKPFESRVLVREAKTDVWRPAFYGFFNQHNKRFYTTSTGTWLMCIPYNEDTKHLTGTTNDCDEYYKTWE